MVLRNVGILPIHYTMSETEMKAARSFETSVYFHDTTLRYNPEVLKLKF